MSDGIVTAGAVGSVGMAAQFKLPRGLLRAERFDVLLSKYAPDIAAEARDFWITLAEQTLKTSRVEYVEGIQLVSADANGFTLALRGELAVAVELGAEDYENPANKSEKKAIPLNLDKEAVSMRPPIYSNPTFRKPGNLGRHPGFKARNLIDDVVEEVNTNIIPKYLQQIVEEL